MDKLAFLTGYQEGLDIAADTIYKKAAVAPIPSLYGYSPDAMNSYQYGKKQESNKAKSKATLMGALSGAGVGGALGAKGGARTALIGALLGAIPGAVVGQGLGTEGIVGGDPDKGRPAADIVRDLKVRQGGVPGTSFEEDYLKPLQRSRIAEGATNATSNNKCY